jgi:hypothetical protein
MFRVLLFLTLALLLSFRVGAEPGDDGPPIAITSPDTGTTYVYGAIKHHALIWNPSQKMLIAQVTFSDVNQDLGAANDDTHEFRLPGISLDEAKGIFTARTAKGEIIPIARYKKMLFMTSIQTLPNAAVRVLHPKGNITVILEAVSPEDPVMHPPPDNSDPDATHKVDISHILN